MAHLEGVILTVVVMGEVWGGGVVGLLEPEDESVQDEIFDRTG